MPLYTAEHFVTSLFRRLTIEMLIILLGFGPSVMDNPVTMIGRSVECIELQRNITGIDNIMCRAGRNEHNKARAKFSANPFEQCLPGPLFHTEELVQLVQFHPNFFLGVQ